MEKVLEFVNTYKPQIAWFILIINLLAGLVAIFDGNLFNTILHFSFVVAIFLDIKINKPAISEENIQS